jgi:hypothetical protein
MESNRIRGQGSSWTVALAEDDMKRVVFFCYKEYDVKANYKAHIPKGKYIKFEVFIDMKIHIVAFWAMTTCSLLG